jgi:hypothetical protein
MGRNSPSLAFPSRGAKSSGLLLGSPSLAFPLRGRWQPAGLTDEVAFNIFTYSSKSLIYIAIGIPKDGDSTLIQVSVALLILSFSFFLIMLGTV